MSVPSNPPISVNLKSNPTVKLTESRQPVLPRSAMSTSKQTPTGTGAIWIPSHNPADASLSDYKPETKCPYPTRKSSVPTEQETYARESVDADNESTF